jgi:hypothetical protein
MKHQLANKSVITFLGALALSGAMLTQAATGPDTVDLTLKWPVGKRLVTKVRVDQAQQIIGAPTGSVNQSVTQEQEIGVDVLKRLDNGGHELGVRFLAMKMDVKMGNTSMMSYDSKEKNADTANPLGATMDQLMEAELKLRTDAKGEVVGVEGMDRLIASLGQGGNPMVGQMLKGMFNEDAIKQMGMLPQGIPNRVVKRGESWPFEMKMEMGPLGKLAIAMTYTFTGWEDHDGIRSAVLDYTGTISSEAGSTGGSAMSMKISGGTMEGKSWFDPQSGLVRDTVGKQTMTMNIDAMGQKLTIRMNQDVSNKLTAIEDIPAL